MGHGFYKIADPFMAFYYQFVVPNRSFIELGRRLPIEQALNAHFSEFVSVQWENAKQHTIVPMLFLKNRPKRGSVKRAFACRHPCADEVGGFSRSSSIGL